MSDADDYVLGREYSEGLRLETQHLLFNIHNGYTIDPKIPITPEMKIADMGTGTGIWLLDLARQVPSTVRLDAFDISDRQFPHKDSRPENISFRILDAFSQVPDELIGKYDVVHLRLWCCIVRDCNTAALIRHATQLLKPGGYLQWDEADLDKMHIKGAEAEAAAAISRAAQAIAHFDYSWIEDLPNRSKEAGLEVLKFEIEPFSKSCISIATRTCIMAFVPGMKFLYQIGDAALPPREEAEATVDALIKALPRGAVYHWTPASLLARKPVV
ncbi:S-adenosyl-L-methionine-dependent methyltransferase [Trichoderma sp. SZMC 28014]